MAEWQDVTREDHNAAVSAARAEGAAAAKKECDERIAAVTTRFATIATSEKLKADAHLMSAALHLATTANMPGDAIVDFVVQNVKSAARASSPASLANRIARDPLTGAQVDANADPLGSAMSGGFLPPTAADGWAEAISKAVGKKEPAK